jgi:hypothetical protein
MKKALLAFAAVLTLVVGANVSGFGTAGIEAATPLPSGCYTDAQGLPVCGPNYPGPGGGAANIVSGNCTSPRPSPPPTGATAIDYTCPTPGPQATPSPSAGSNITISGSWPYTIAASGGGSITSPASYDAMVEGETNLVNYWPLSDASGAPVDDALGTTLTAVGTVTYHTASLLSNGDLSMTFPGAGNTNYFTSTGNFGFGNAPGMFWMEAWVKWATVPSAASTIWANFGGSGNNGMGLTLSASNHFQITCSNVASYDTGFTAVSGTTYYIAFAWANGYSYFFVNNTLEYQHANLCDPISVANAFEIGSNGIQGGNSMIIQKLAFYSGAPTLGEISRHYTAGTSGTYKWAWNP